MPSSARSQWPQVQVGVQFSSGIWTETTSGRPPGSVGLAVAAQMARGRQYELARTEAGEGRLTWDNADGRYAPGGSRVSGSLYQRVRLLATWNGVTYPVLLGYVERWPETFTDAGVLGADMVAPVVDAFALFAGRTLSSVVTEELLADLPAVLWPMDEASGSAAMAGEVVSPTTNPALLQQDSSAGAAGVVMGAAFTVQPSTGGPVAGAPAVPSGLLGAQFSNATNASSATAAQSTLGTPTRLGAPMLQPGSTVEITYQATAPQSPSGAPVVNVLWAQYDTATRNFFVVYLDETHQPRFAYAYGTPKSVYFVRTAWSSIGVASLYGEHSISISLSAVSGGTVSVTTQIDDQNAVSRDGFPVDGVDFSVQTLVQVGGWVGNGEHLTGVSARISHVASFGARGLTGLRRAQHYLAGVTAFSGESSDARVNRLLSYVGWPPASRNVTAGSSLMGAATLAGVSVLQALQDVADAELGTLWLDASGTVQFRGRQARFNSTAASVVFGENVAGGEVPYLDDIAFDFDPTYVFSQVKVSVSNGPTFVASPAAGSSLPIPKSLERTVNLASASEAADQANWLANQYAVPKRRVATLRFDPSACPSSWPTALGLDVGTRVTVKRRPLNQPATSSDFWVESVAHDISPDGWVVTLLMSPVDSPHALLSDSTDTSDGPAVAAF